MIPKTAVYENLIVEKDGAIQIITLNRPHVHNALNDAILSELDAALTEAEMNPEVQVIMITGAGEKSFAAGADIKELEDVNTLNAVPFCGKGQGLFNKMENMSKPIIAAVNGFALGGGCELAMACDIRIASENARFGQPEVALGIIPGYGGTQRLPRLVGKGKAMEIILSGEPINAEEAHRIGLVNLVVPLQNLMESARALASKIMEKSPVAVRLAKRAIHVGLNMTIEEGCKFEAAQFASVCAMEDKREGISAFIEKRKPIFKNR